MKVKSLCLSVLFLVLTSGCGDDDAEGECDLSSPDCASGMVCESSVDGKAYCVAPLTIRGMVVDATDETPIEGALVQAVDPNGAATGTSAQTDSNGTYVLTVPALRDADGVPDDGAYTLRAQAALYQAFPSALRPATPLAATSAQGNGEDGWTIENAQTTIKLLPIPVTDGLGSISGTILADDHGGILMVAESGGAGYTGFSDSEGHYTIFNVPAGSYSVDGYAAGVQLAPAEITLGAGEDKTGVDLSESAEPLSSISGHVQIVNAPGGATTSVVLAVESTFVENTARGEVPPGLRIGEVTTDFVIPDVPDGNYVVLAAFENDDLVRDPDETIGGTQIVYIQVPDAVDGNAIVLDEGFKITEALEIFSPGALGPEPVTTVTPLLNFANDTSEEGYTVQVFDAFGEEIWSTDLGPSSESLEVEYAGPALEEGMYYQFKARSWRVKTDVRTSISATEDLKGVFFYEPSD